MCLTMGWPPWGTATTANPRTPRQFAAREASCTLLIGPVSDKQAYAAAKQELDKIGLSTFMRQYEK